VRRGSERLGDRDKSRRAGGAGVVEVEEGRGAKAGASVGGQKGAGAGGVMWCMMIPGSGRVGRC
jgi:hypothetical protein